MTNDLTAPDATPCRVDLGKRPGGYLVIADDSAPVTSVADHFRADRLPERAVRYVERLADAPEARFAQWDELIGDCLDVASVSLLSYAAVSHGHAAYLARREYAVARAADRMAEVIDGHLERGARGWIAIRLADGGSDGEVYADAAAAEAAQQQPGRCIYLPISPLCPWPLDQCIERLTSMGDMRSSRLAREIDATR